MAFYTLGVPPEVARGNPIVRTAVQKAADVALPEKVRGNRLGISKFTAVALVMAVKIGIEQAVSATTGVSIAIPTFGLAGKLARRFSRGPKKPSLKATTATREPGTSGPTAHSYPPAGPSFIAMPTAHWPSTQTVHPLATHPLAGSPLAAEAVFSTPSRTSTMHSNVGSTQVLTENPAMPQHSFVSTATGSFLAAKVSNSLSPSVHTASSTSSENLLYEQVVNMLHSPSVQQPSLTTLPTESPDTTSAAQAPMSQPLAPPTPLALPQHGLQAQQSLIHDPAILQAPHPLSVTSHQLRHLGLNGLPSQQNQPIHGQLPISQPPSRPNPPPAHPTAPSVWGSIHQQHIQPYFNQQQVFPGSAAQGYQIVQQADPYRTAPQASSMMNPTNLLVTTMLAEQVASLAPAATTAMPNLLNQPSQSDAIPPPNDSTADPSLQQGLYTGPISDPFSMQDGVGISGVGSGSVGGSGGDPYSAMGGADPYGPSSNFVGTGGFGAGETTVDYPTYAPSVIIGDDGGDSEFDDGDNSDDDF
jgi:hypothetical protein